MPSGPQRTSTASLPCRLSVSEGGPPLPQRRSSGYKCLPVVHVVQAVFPVAAHNFPT